MTRITGSATTDFEFGVASGDPTTTSVMLWTHVRHDAGPIDWEIDDGRGDRRSGTVHPTDGVVRVDVARLTPATTYHYRFCVGDTWSPTGTTRTLPVASTTFHLAVVCCSRWPAGDFGLYRAVADARPDLVLHLGDYIYSDGEDGPRGTHDPPHECRTADDYERRYRQYRSDGDLQVLHAAAPWVAIWDDHEFTSNAWRRGAPHADADESWTERRNTAIDAQRRWMPQHPHGNGPTPVDRLLHLGTSADLVLVDTRMAGRESPPGKSGGPRRAPTWGEQRRLLTETQWRWLDEVIESSTADHLLIASSVQMAPLRLAPTPARRWPPVRWLVNPDQWDGYPRERQRLVGLLTSHGRHDAVVLSGDLHARFEIAAGTGHLREITTPSINAVPFAEAVRSATAPVPTALLEWWLQRCNPHIEQLDLTSHGATILRITPDDIGVHPLTRR